MKKENILSLLEEDSMVEEQGLNLTTSKPVNIGRLSGMVYNPKEYEIPRTK